MQNAGCGNNYISYTIAKGQTLYAIARQFGITVAEILAANPALDVQLYYAGDVICIPKPGGGTGSTCNGHAHTIVRGDTYQALAQHYGVTVAAITNANPGVNPNRLQVGQVICIPGAPAPAPNPPAGCTGTAHTIVRGDTYYTLAQHYGVTVAAITAANPGVDPNALRVGQVICIPGHPAPEGCTTFSHTVARGESFYSIAQLYGITVADLIAANPGIDPAKLQIGQELCIPTPPPTPVPPPAPTPVACQIGINGIGYVVQRGDTFYKIAQQYGLTVQALQEANPGVDPARLQIGQVLCVPGGQPAPTPCPAGHSVHTVTSGQTLTDILVLYNLGYNALAQANAGVDLANLRAGQTLCIAPRGTRGGCAGGGASYQMTNVDTLSTMAARFGVTIGDILLANPHMAPTDFPTGRVICLPAHART
ncbi:MAG: LysM peptidoglycan-binding domain-containing protein [Oscillospiraceae bacterium]|jgi:LysM repeat protein|nr:LysM peptidoglycan-binding domain-containing protein [Oscillospiraceae bacterium]